MDAAQIAEKLTPAQIVLLRVLADGKAHRWDDTPYSDWRDMDVWELLKSGPDSLSSDVITPLGLAVLAALDAKEAGNE